MPRPLSSFGNHRLISQRRSASVAIAACAVMLCSLPSGGSSQSRPAARSAQPPAPTPTVRVRVVRAAESSAERVVMLIQVEAEGVRLGSYQGQLRFDPLVFGVDSSAAGRDGTRMVNAADAGRGVIRFAGFATTGFTSDVAARLVARVPRSLSAERLSASLEARLDIAGDLDGRPLPKAALVSSSGLARQP